MVAGESLNVEIIEFSIESKGSKILNYESCALIINCGYIGKWEIVFKSQTNLDKVTGLLGMPIGFRAINRNQMEITNNFNSAVPMKVFVINFDKK